MRLPFRRKGSAKTGNDSKKKNRNKRNNDSNASLTTTASNNNNNTANTASAGNNGRRNNNKKKKNHPSALRMRSSNFSSPLNTIEETHDEPDQLHTGQTAKSTPSASSVLSSVQVVSVNSVDAATEVVFGSNNEDTVRKQLFDGNGQEEEDPDDQYDLQEDEPYDARLQTEDPTIIDMLRAQSPLDEEDEEKEPEKEQQGPTNVDNVPPTTTTKSSKTRAAPVVNQKQQGGPGSADVARRLLDAFNCDTDTTGPTKARSGPSLRPYDFYDSICGQGDRKSRKPFFNKEFALEFLQEGATIGFPLLLHVPPETPSDEEFWTGMSVSMYIRFGSHHGSQLKVPRLEWTTAGGGSRSGQNKVSQTTSVSLVEILAIVDTVDEEVDLDAIAMEEEDLCFFSITTNNGDVHMFEAVTWEERDRIVCGLKNVVARLSFCLVAGDEAVADEFFQQALADQGELPLLKTKAQHMNDLTHVFLDTTIPVKATPSSTTTTVASL